MPNPNYPPTTLVEATTLFTEDATIIHDVVNGSDSDTVEVDDGLLIPSLRKTIKDITDSIGYQIIGDFSDVVKEEIVNSNQVYSSKSIVNFEDGLYRYLGQLPYTPTESEPNANWASVALGELKSAMLAVGAGYTDGIYSIDTTTAIPSYIFVPSTQQTYSVPSDAQGKTILTVVEDLLTTTDLVEYTLETAEKSVLELTTAEAVASTTLKLGDVVKASDRGKEEFKVVLASTVTPNTLDIITCTGKPNLALQLQYRGSEESAIAWGHDGTNLKAVIDRIASYAVTQTKRIEITLDNDSTSSDAIEINTDVIKLNLGGNSIDFSASATGAFVISSTTSPGYGNGIAAIYNGEFYASRTAGQKAVSYVSSTAGASCRSFLRDIVIHDFDVAAEYGDRAYLIKNYNVTIYACNVIIYVLDGDDNGENITFTDSAFFNSSAIFRNRKSSASVTLVNCSLDYCGQLVDMDGGDLRVLGGHIETNTSNTHIVMTGGRAILEPTILRYDGAVPPDYYASVSAGASLAIKSRVSFGDVAQKTATDRFYTGAGLVQIENLSQAKMPALLSNNLNDNLNTQPFFNSLLREVFFTTSATDWHSSPEATMTVSSNALVVTKGSSNPCKFALSGELKGDNESVGCIINGNSVGVWGYDIKYVRLDATQTPPVLVKQLTVKSTTGLTGSETIQSNRLTDVAPKWATHWICEVDASNLTGGQSISISEARIQRVG